MKLKTISRGSRPLIQEISVQDVLEEGRSKQEDREILIVARKVLLVAEPSTSQSVH